MTAAPKDVKDAPAMKLKRKAITKSVRFEIFKRDGFKCRYCGATSESVTLVVDHVIPVAKGGSSELDNLITACEPCNQGKAARSIDPSCLSEEDRLRMAQERNEIIQLAEKANEATRAKEQLEQTICNYWCIAKGTEAMCTHTLRVMCSFARQHGAETVFVWIDLAMQAVAHKQDSQIGKYISGIRRRIMEEEECE